MSKALKILVGLSFLAQSAAAQTPPAGTTQTEITLPKKAAVSSQDMVNQAREYRGRVQEILLRITSLQEQARKAKDIIRLNCLADKLVQAKVNLNITEQAITAVQEASSRKDEAGALHEFTRVTIVHQKAQVLGAEAEACVGEDLSFVGATKVEVSVDASIPAGDTTNLPKIDRPGGIGSSMPGDLQRPPAASASK